MTVSVTARGSTMPVPTVFATAVVKNAPAMFIIAARATAVSGERTLVDTTVAIALAASCQPFAISKSTARIMMRSRISCIFEDYGLENIRDIFRPI